MDLESNTKQHTQDQRIKIHQPDANKIDSFDPRHRIYVRAINGFWSQLRKKINWVALSVFLILPWISWNNRQAVWFDISDQKFHIFGLVIWPQDFTLLAAVFMIAAFGLFFFTTYLGRVWCGYSCPQTVWTFIFIWFEEKLEGTRNKRIKLDQMPWNMNKICRKITKHVVWLLISLITALTFISFFVPATSLYTNFFSLNETVSVYFWVTFFTLATYVNAGWMREIMCIHICPYARFQSSMFDKNTFIVGYDRKRGEKRGPRAKKDKYKSVGLGDCIDCDLCVQVCPTGIDIRNGLQYECINCGACIDACDQTMAQMGYPKGLIRYTSENSLTGHNQKVWRPKLIGYGTALFIMLVVLIYATTTVSPLRIDIIRDRHILYRENIDGLIENTYTLKIVNKSEQQKYYQLSLDGLDNYQWLGKRHITIAAGEVMTLPFCIAVEPNNLKSPVTDININVIGDTKVGQAVIKSQASRFFSP